MMVKNHQWPSRLQDGWSQKVFFHHPTILDGHEKPNTTIQIMKQILKLMWIISISLLTLWCPWPSDHWEWVLLASDSVCRWHSDHWEWVLLASDSDNWLRFRFGHQQPLNHRVHHLLDTSDLIITGVQPCNIVKSRLHVIVFNLDTGDLVVTGVQIWFWANYLNINLTLSGSTIRKENREGHSYLYIRLVHTTTTYFLYVCLIYHAWDDHLLFTAKNNIRWPYKWGATAHHDLFTLGVCVCVRV